MGVHNGFHITQSQTESFNVMNVFIAVGPEEFIEYLIHVFRPDALALIRNRDEDTLLGVGG